MKQALVLFTILILSLALVTSNLNTQYADAKPSKHEKAIDKGLDKFFDEKKWKDACAVYAVKENNGDPTEGKWVYNNTSDEQCNPEDQVPEPPKNQPPIIVVTSPITGVINQTIIINASVTDPDGNITNIIWNQESGQAVNFTSNSSVLVFTPIANDTYVFSIDAQDNNGTSTLGKVKVLIGVTEPDPDPDPVPTNETKTVIFVGDPDGSVGEQVFNQIKATDFHLAVVLGDLWYGDWEKFSATYGSLRNKVACVLGNHEYDSSEIERLALDYCGNDWAINSGFNGVLIIGINANENLDQQVTDIKGYFADEESMKGIHTVVINTHQPCKNTDNSHHGVEEPQFCNDLNAAIPSGLHEYWISGHEHLYMEGQDGEDKYFIVGTGGRNHYDCGTLPDPVFTLCDDKHYGFLKMDIEPDGDIKTQFIDANGGVVN